MPNTVDALVQELKDSLPPVFAGAALDRLTGDAILWRTVQNARSNKQIPESCFVYSGRKVLVCRDAFLHWWQTSLSESPRRNEGS